MVIESDRFDIGERAGEEGRKTFIGRASVHEQILRQHPRRSSRANREIGVPGNANLLIGILASRTDYLRTRAISQYEDTFFVRSRSGKKFRHE